MSDYIKREDAIRKIVKTSAQNELDIPAIGTVIYILSEMDSADVVEVVRCKDCKYRSKKWYEDKRNKDGGYWLVCCENDAIAERVYGLAQDNDYCSYGERKDEGL